MSDKKKINILIIDDELHICRNCIKILSRESSYGLNFCLNGVEAIEAMEKHNFEIVLTDLNMDRLGGMEVLRRINDFAPETIVIVMTGYASVSSAVEVMKLGAFDYLPKPFTPHELRAVVKQAVTRMKVKKQQQKLKKNGHSTKQISHQLIGNSHEIKKVIDLVQKVAPTDATVLISGESGTGKELIARAVHVNSHRQQKAFFAIDCGTLTSELLTSELFGHVKGAFTGAGKDKAGIFKLAHKGTVFLDEVSNINIEVQGKLLRFLETREFMPLGDTKIEQVDIRLIFATNKNLENMVKKGAFRQDFYYRIAVYPIELPPLKDRKSDILPIAYYFLREFSKKINKDIKAFDDKAASRINAYNWPGNVRQLKNVIERAVILAEGKNITPKDLPLLGEISEIGEMIESIPKTNAELKQLKKEIRQKAVSRVERNFILNALSENDWNVSKASRKTGLQRTNFQTLMKKHSITRP